MLRNPYRALLDLLPEEPLQVGTVISYSDGEATIALPGGGICKARGSASVDQMVYFKGGAIQSSAAAMTVVEIEI